MAGKEFGWGRAWRWGEVRRKRRRRRRRSEGGREGGREKDASAQVLIPAVAA
jgi:hypothetical protein